MSLAPDPGPSQEQHSDEGRSSGGWAVAALPLLLAACATLPEQPADARPAAPRAPAMCNAAPAQFAVGRPYDAALAETVRQRSGAAVARVLRPGQMVTMEFSAERVSIDVDAKGMVHRVRCG